MRCAVALPMAIGLASSAGATDPSPTGTPQQSVAQTNCFANFWGWLNASISDCPLTYAGFTLYGTVDVGYGYDTAGVRFGKWYDKGVFYRIPVSARGGPGLPTR